MTDSSNQTPRKDPIDRKLSYRWDTETREGFDSCVLIYDREGRLLGIDYSTVNGRAPVNGH